VNVGSGISSDADKTNCNILHFLAKQCMQQQLSDVLLTIYVSRSHYVNLYLPNFLADLFSNTLLQMNVKFVAFKQYAKLPLMVFVMLSYARVQLRHRQYHLTVYMSVCLSVCLSVCPPVCLSVCLSVRG